MKSRLARIWVIKTIVKQIWGIHKVTQNLQTSNTISTFSFIIINNLIIFISILLLAVNFFNIFIDVTKHISFQKPKCIPPGDRYSSLTKPQLVFYSTDKSLTILENFMR